MEQDWRLQGQEHFLLGAKLYHKVYKQPSKSWDHDHCDFCWNKFAESQVIPDALHEGYTTLDRQHWVCETCFSDFKDYFDWIVIQDPQNND